MKSTLLYSTLGHVIASESSHKTTHTHQQGHAAPPEAADGHPGHGLPGPHGFPFHHIFGGHGGAGPHMFGPAPHAHGGPPGHDTDFEIHFAPLPSGPHGAGPRNGPGGMMTMMDLLSVFPAIGDHNGPAQMESDDDGETITVMMIPPTGPGGPPVSLFGGPPPQMIHGPDIHAQKVHDPMALRHQMDKNMDHIMGSIMDDITAGFAHSVLPALKKLDQEQHGRPCHADLEKHCSHSTKKLHCLGQHRDDISPVCADKIKRSVSFACAHEIHLHCQDINEGVLPCLERTMTHGHAFSEGCRDSVAATRAVSKTLNTHTSTVVHKPSGTAVHVSHPFSQWFHCAGLGKECQCKNGFVRYGMSGKFSQVIRSHDQVQCLPQSFDAKTGDDEEDGKQPLIQGAGCECLLERFPTSHAWNMCADENKQCQCSGAVRYGDGVSWSMPIHSTKEILCEHNTFHFHPKTFDTSKHHCQCLPRHEVKAADALSHPSIGRPMPSMLSFVGCMIVLLLVVAFAVGKVAMPRYTRIMMWRNKFDGYSMAESTEMNMYVCKDNMADGVGDYGTQDI